MKGYVMMIPSFVEVIHKEKAWNILQVVVQLLITLKPAPEEVALAGGQVC